MDLSLVETVVGCTVADVLAVEVREGELEVFPAAEVVGDVDDVESLRNTIFNYFSRILNFSEILTGK